MTIELFPFSDYLWLYGSFIGCVLALLALDLGVFHRKIHEVSFREAAVWSVIWIALALGFNYGLYQYARWQFTVDERLLSIPGFDPAIAARGVGLEFLTGYVVEKSLSVDNIFIFVVIFRYFSIPPVYQHRVLFYGIIGALIFRIIFIALGSVLMDHTWIVVIFGLFLIFTGLKLFFAPDIGIEPEKNPLIRLFRRYFPVTPGLQGGKFFVRQQGTLAMTPLFVTLLFVEFTDIIFAVDSVPAIFALTREPLIVFTSNVFAMLGLRSLYFMLAGVVNKFHLLRYGLAVVLVFVGLKMVWLNDLFGGKFPIELSLGIITTVIGISILLSLLLPPKNPAQTPDPPR